MQATFTLGNFALALRWVAMRTQFPVEYEPKLSKVLFSAVIDSIICFYKKGVCPDTAAKVKDGVYLNELPIITYL